MKFLLAYYLFACIAVFVVQATVKESKRDVVTDWIVFPIMLLSWPIFEALRLGQKARRLFRD